MARLKKPRKVSANANKNVSKKKKKEVESQCTSCIPAKCCQYFSLEIDTPASKSDYDDLLWFLAHKDVSIYTQNKSWYLMLHNRCTFLNKKSNLCKIYDKRPRICRAHTTDECEFAEDWDFDKHFKSYDELERWLLKKGKLKRKKRTKK
jgi:Fe-S-cluster containining protein